MRRLTISKICALWIAGLILVPFTAPFRTYELATAPCGGSHDALPKDKVDADEKIVLSDGSLVLPALNFVVARPVPCQSQVEQPLFHYAILRL